MAAPARLAAMFDAWRATLRTRAAAWVRRRQGEDQLPVRVSTRRVYILPTRAGVAFSMLLLVMLLAGINYANSLAMMLTFLLGGFAIIAMHLTHRNLVGVVVVSMSVVDAFAGEHGLVRMLLESSGRTRRFAIDCEVDEGERITVTLAETGSVTAALPVPLIRRGRRLLRRVKLSTAFPFGLFRAWTYVHRDVAVLAWPVPRGRQEPPPQAALGGAASALHRAGEEEWAGLREFRQGDSPRQVAWAAYARGRGLLVKTYDSPSAQHRLFSLDATRGDLEQRLEQMSAWVVAAHARGEQYGLRLDSDGGRGSTDIAIGSGGEHRKRCLDALALYGSAAP